MTDDHDKKSAPTAPNFPEIELGILEYWRQNNTFEKSLEKTTNNPPYIFYDGPPFATGLPHYGSLLPSIIKDAIPRFQTMQGKYVRRRWGWDCHGLPIENIVEQKLGISGKKQIEEIGVERFNAVCRENVLTYTHDWSATIERIARWVEFDNAYKTMDTTFMESVWWGLKQIWDKGLIYEDNKVLMYCSRCETPVSNFEVAMDNSYKDVTENSVFVKFRLLPKQRIVDFITTDRTYAIAWTTTPWTLPGNTALNIGPDITYVIVEQADQQYIVAKDRLSVLEGQYEVKLEMTARSLEGLSYEPLYSGVIDNASGTAHRIYAEDYVTTTDGTGIVHNAAMYGEVDYEAAKKRNLPRIAMLDHQGAYMDNAPASLRGKFFKDADPQVLQELSDKGLVYRVEAFTHSYPHCWRCGTPLYYSALPAWFINIQKIKPRLLELNEQIQWYPEYLKHGRFQKGIESAPDWNISRNRYWATALPFWKCDTSSCNNIVCVGGIAELRNQAVNFDAVYPEYDPANINALDLHKPYVDRVQLSCKSCGGTMSRVPEVVDCWVESGSMPFAELHYPFENQELFKQRFPSDFVVEYIPQTRAWFYVMHVISTILFNAAPFKNVMTTGTILAEDGAKMSKSKNNYPDPQLILNQYGADSLRFYLLTSPVVTGEDLNFSEKGVAEVGRKLSMILYNVWSFYRMYARGVVSDVAPTSQHVLDRWVLDYFARTHVRVTEYLHSFNTVKAGREIQDFVTELSTWYVRRSRDRIKSGSEASEQALAMLGYVLMETSKLLAPFMPFLSEFLFRDLTSKESVHLQSWTSGLSAGQDSLAAMEQVRKLVELGLGLRKELNIKLRQPLAELQYISGTGDETLATDFAAIILEELNVKKITAVSEFVSRSGWATKLENGMGVALNAELTPELKSEGLARELERQLQDLRKKSGLQIGEVVDVYYNTTAEELSDVLVRLVDRKKIFINQIQTSLEVEADYETQATVDGNVIWFGIVKV